MLTLVNIIQSYAPKVVHIICVSVLFSLFSSIFKQKFSRKCLYFCKKFAKMLDILLYARKEVTFADFGCEQEKR
jgi:hypothetical protein